MSRYRKLTAICAAAALALGLAACGGGGSSTPPVTDTGDDTKKGTSVVPAPGSCTDAACVKLFADALTAAQNELAALRADPKSTQAQITAATNAVTAAQTALSTAQTALATYNAKQPPTYVAKAMNTAVKATPGTSFNPTTATNAVDGGKVTDSSTTNKYAKASWPVPAITGWAGSVYEKSNTAGDMMNSIVVYTDVEKPRAVNFTKYYTKGGSGTPTTGAPKGFSWVPWINAIVSVSNDEKGTITFNGDTISKADASKLFSATKLPGKGVTRDYPDDDKDKAGLQVEFPGSFHGVAGTFKCSGTADDAACGAAMTLEGALSFTTADGTVWSFVPTSTTGTVADVQTDNDYLDFGYWVLKDTSGTETAYTVEAFQRGKLPHTNVTAVNGSATYKGAAAGLYTKREYASGDEEGAVTATGRFTATAELTAYFGTYNIPNPKTGASTNVSNSMNGKIRNFMDGDKPIDASWTVELKAEPGSISNNAASGATTGGGTWSASFYGSSDGTPTPLPTGVAGEFTGAFGNGDVVGAFGATKQ